MNTFKRICGLIAAAVLVAVWAGGLYAWLLFSWRLGYGS